VRGLAKSVRIELKLAAYQIASQNVHLGSDLSRAFPYLGTNHRHVPQGTRIDALQQGLALSRLAPSTPGLPSSCACEPLTPRPQIYRCPIYLWKSLYDVLRITPTASLAELRVAFKLRQLEFRAAGTPNLDSATLERALNILAQPELRACYDSLLKDSSAPALFRYGGFGSILLAGA